MTFTIADHFCGMGGSTLGLENAGFTPRLAINHWPQAIETHGANHPLVDHYCHNLQKAHPSTYPRTDVAWFSPECTHHSNAEGKSKRNLDQLSMFDDSGISPEDERSRATMLEVYNYTKFHHYLMVLVENVVEVRKWKHYTTWLNEMCKLGYEYQTAYINAQFFNVPQSRDRIYIVFHQRGLKAPDLQHRPDATCSKCGCIKAVQAWKDPINKSWGKYGRNGQYWYKCPTCAEIVFPYAPPASSVIDWTIEGEVIADRKEPLVENTLERIRAGLRKFTVPEESMIVSYYSRKSATSRTDNPLPTIPTENRHGLLEIDSSFLTIFNSKDKGHDINVPMPTIMTTNHHGLVQPFLSCYNGSGEGQPTTLDRPMWTIPTHDRFGLVQPQFAAKDLNDVLMTSRFRMLEPHELKRGQSFPEAYKVLGIKADKVKQIGNAVCPAVAQWLGERCMAALKAS